MGRAKPSCRRLFKGSYRLTEDELLGFKYMSDGVEQLLLERAVLPLQVKHGYRLYRCGGTLRGGTLRRCGSAFHMVHVTSRSHRRISTGTETMRCSAGFAQRPVEKVCEPI
jgi:hypothetical protein